MCRERRVKNESILSREYFTSKSKEFDNHFISKRRKHVEYIYAVRSRTEDAWIRLKNDGERIDVAGTRNKIYPRNLSSLSFSADILRAPKFSVCGNVREVYADGFAILRAARNNLHNCAGPFAIAFSTRREFSLFNELLSRNEWRKLHFNYSCKSYRLQSR